MASSESAASSHSASALSATASASTSTSAAPSAWGPLCPPELDTIVKDKFRFSAEELQAAEDADLLAHLPEDVIQGHPRYKAMRDALRTRRIRKEQRRKARDWAFQLTAFKAHIQDSKRAIRAAVRKTFTDAEAILRPHYQNTYDGRTSVKELLALFINRVDMTLEPITDMVERKRDNSGWERHDEAPSHDRDEDSA